jgi:bisphosphoglycerate-independent phosphoglycerate mutase (AlkP superfamily)
MTIAVQEIHKVERLIEALLQKISIKETTLIVISDHGNIEDIRVKSHTMNPAYMALWTTDNDYTFNSILDIYPFLISVIMKNRKKS